MEVRGKTALDQAQIDALMTDSWIVRVATIGPGEKINLTPLWYCWAEGKIYAFTRGQKVENLRRNPACSAMADQNELYPELNGVMFQGTARVLENADEEKADPHLDSIVRDRMGLKYQKGGFGSAKTRNESSAMGKNWRWIVITPDVAFSWDNRKVSRGKK